MTSRMRYNDYPVVGVSWEQANAFCAWRTMYLQRGMSGAARQIQRYRLPTEVEWEFAARGSEAGRYPWSGSSTRTEKGCYNANFKPERGNYTRDGNLITSRVASYSPNSNGLYDMAGNVAEWTSTVYTEAGVLSMNDLNPELTYRGRMWQKMSVRICAVMNTRMKAGLTSVSAVCGAVWGRLTVEDDKSSDRWQQKIIAIKRKA